MSIVAILISLLIGLVSVVLIKRQFNKSKSDSIPPVFWYPPLKNENYKWIQKTVADGTLPKLFRPNFFWQSHRISNAIVIADYDLIKEAFRKGLLNE